MVAIVIALVTPGSSFFIITVPDASYNAKEGYPMWNEVRYIGVCRCKLRKL